MNSRQRIQSKPKIYQGLAEIIWNYEGLLVDLWGVIHDGVHLYTGVIECLEQLKKHGKQVVFLSNAPRRKHVIQQGLESMGISQKYYDDILTSGEDAYYHLRNRIDPWYASLGDRCFHLGLEFKIKNLCSDLNFEYVNKITDADFILNTGLDLEEESLEVFDKNFKDAAEKKIPMICVNPDQIVIHSGRTIFPAGYLAKHYEDHGGFVRYHGKPYPSIYEQVCKLFPPASRLIAVGDSLSTDIKGANQSNLDSILIARGIHAKELNSTEPDFLKDDKLEALYNKYQAQPLYVLPAFQWTVP